MEKATWEILDTALGHLESPSFNERKYASVFRGRLEAELKRIFDWLADSDGGLELYPSPESVYLAGLVMELKGVDAVGPCDIVREALLILDAERDADGRIPGRLLNNYFTLRHALEFGDCAEWSVISLAKGIIFAS